MSSRDQRFALHSFAKAPRDGISVNTWKRGDRDYVVAVIEHRATRKKQKLVTVVHDTWNTSSESDAHNVISWRAIPQARAIAKRRRKRDKRK